MEHQRNKIQALPKDVRSLIRTGVALTSFAQAVEELVLNAVDAKATSIAVRIDLSCFRIQVVDNGQGIAVNQFPLIGERYSTSKCHSVEDLENLNYFGYRGEALASLQNAASFLEVASRPKGSCITYSKCFQRGESLGVTQPSTHRPSHGTTVTAHDLFYNLPVRRNGFNIALEVEKIRYRLAGIALMWPKVSVSLRDDSLGNVILQTQKCSGILAVFSQLFTPARAKGLAEVGMDTHDFRISGLVSKESYSRKDLQFVFVNKRLVLKSSVHKQINKIFRRSLVLKRKGAGAEETEKIGNYSQSNYPQGSPSKQIDLYPIFVLNIECSFKEYDITFDPSKTLVEFRDWPKLIHTLQDMLYGFLRKEDLLLPNMCSPSKSDKMDDVAKVSSEIAYKDDLYCNNISIGNNLSVPQQFSTTAVDSLFSETVHRPENHPTSKPTSSETLCTISRDRNVNDNDKTSESLPVLTTSKSNEQNNVNRKVCFDINEHSRQNFSDNLTENSNFISSSSKAINLKCDNFMNLKTRRGNYIPCPQPSASNTVSPKGIVSYGDDVDEEEPLVRMSCNVESESEHPLKGNNSSIQQITLGESAGYSSTLKSLREINPFYAAPKDVSKVIVHTLQNLKKCSHKHSVNVNELLKTPEKATRRKSTEAAHASSPSKQQKIERADAHSNNECSNDDLISREEEMHIDSDMGHHDKNDASSVISKCTNSSIPTSHSNSLSHEENDIMETKRKEKENPNRTALKKSSSHSSKLARIMKGINKSEESRRSKVSKHMTRLKSFTYAKEGKQSSDNKTSFPESGMSISESHCNSDDCTEEISRAHVSQETFHVVSGNTPHICKENGSNEASLKEPCEVESMAAGAHQLPFAMYSAAKETNINTPKLSLVLSIPMTTDLNSEQLSSVGSDAVHDLHREPSRNNSPMNCASPSANYLSVNCSEPSKSSNEIALQNAPIVVDRAAVDVHKECSNDCPLIKNPQARYDEIGLDKISIQDVCKEDCSSGSSQGFDVRRNCHHPCSHTPLSIFNDNDSTKRTSPSQHHIAIISSKKSSLELQESELNSSYIRPDISNIPIENKKKEKCEHPPAKFVELCAKDFHLEKRNETHEEIYKPTFQNEDTYRVPTNRSETLNVIGKDNSNEDGKLHFSQTDSTMTAQSMKSLDSKNILTLKKRNFSEDLCSEETSSVNSMGMEGSSTRGNQLIGKTKDFDKNSASSFSVAGCFKQKDTKVEYSGINESCINDKNVTNTRCNSSSSTSSIPCGQKENVSDKTNSSSSSDVLSEQMQNVFEKVNIESRSSIPSGQQRNGDMEMNESSSSTLNGQPENVNFENEKSMPLLCVSSQCLVELSSDKTLNVELGKQNETCCSSLNVQCDENVMYSNMFDKSSHRIDSSQGTGCAREATNAGEKDLTDCPFGVQRKKLISLSNAVKESSKPATESPSFVVTTSDSPMKEKLSVHIDVGIVIDSDKTSVIKVVDEEIQDLSKMRKTVQPENKSVLSVHENKSLATDTDQTNGHESETMTHWCCVTQPVSGTSVYVNNKSGHSISKEQWSKLESHKQDELMAHNPDNENPQQPNDSDGVNGENLYTLSKWRDGKTPTYDAEKGGDVASVISEWTDTVFLKYKLPSVLSLNNSDENNPKANANTPSRVEFTKEMLQYVKVLGQVDNKFIACRIEKKNTAPNGDAFSSSRTENSPLLVFFDQHAVHERVRLESLTTEAYEYQVESGAQRLKREMITPSLVLQLNQDDVRLMKAFAKEFERIGIEFNVKKGCRDKIVVNSVPLSMTESKRIKGALKEKTQELISEHIDLLKSTNGTCGKLPLAIHRVLCSQACRGAVKFGDPLSHSECIELLSKLSYCNLPFQCAHGRPSIAPLMNLHDLEMEFKDAVKRPRLQNITRLMKTNNTNNDTGIE